MDADIWEGAFKAGVELAKDTVAKPFMSVWQNFQWKRAAQTYREKIQEWYGTTRILGKPDAVPLEGIFTDVYIWDKPQAMRYFTVEALEADFQRGDSHKGLERLDGLVALEQNPRLFILGKPGAGKTTFLKWVALLSAQEYLHGIPMFVSLKELADANSTVMGQILKAFTDCQFPNAEPFVEALLQSGRANILLDGLDEVQAEQGIQDRVMNDIRDFVKRYGKNRFLLTCRIAAVSYAFETFKYVEMADFTPEQVKTYISRYFSKDRAQAQACLKELQKSEHQGLRELARSPLLLSLLCLNFEEGGTFPPRRVTLYEEALSALLKRWDGSRRIKRDEPYKALDAGRKPHLYAYLAYQNFERGRYFIPTLELERQTVQFLRTMPEMPIALDGEQVVRAMEAQHGIIVERARNIHAYAHLTFQEYYTARYIIDNVANNTLGALFTHITDVRWREVFLLTASLWGNADHFFEQFIEAVGGIIQKDKKLVDLLLYVRQREGFYVNKTAIEGCLYSIYFSLERDLDLDRHRDLARALALTRDRALALERALALDRHRDLALAYLAPVEQVEVGLFVLGTTLWVSESVPIFVKAVVTGASAMGNSTLGKELQKLKIPKHGDRGGSDVEWVEFRNQIQHLAFIHRGVRFDWGFTEEQIGHLNDYFYATNLLVECLKVAVVSNREWIKSRLLLPPDA